MQLEGPATSPLPLRLHYGCHSVAPATTSHGLQEEEEDEEDSEQEQLVLRVRNTFLELTRKEKKRLQRSHSDSSLTSELGSTYTATSGEKAYSSSGTAGLSGSNLSSASQPWCTSSDPSMHESSTSSKASEGFSSPPVDLALQAIKDSVRALRNMRPSPETDESVVHEKEAGEPAVDPPYDLSAQELSDSASHGGLREELPSRGSAGHFAGRCQPCKGMTSLISITNENGKATCQRGKDCDFCHFPHISKRRPGKLRRAQLRKAASKMSSAAVEELQEVTGQTKGYESQGLAFMISTLR